MSKSYIYQSDSFIIVVVEIAHCIPTLVQEFSETERLIQIQQTED